MASKKKTAKALEKKVKVAKKASSNPPLEVKTIEHIAETGSTNKSKPKAFLTKKKIILTIIFFLISVGFAVITIRPILHVNWHEFNVSVGTGIALNWGWLWLFLILAQLFINLNRGFFTFIPRLKKWGYNISYKDFMLYSITSCFIGSVSPANIISDPYTIFWLRTHGVPTSRAVGMFFTNSLFWQVAQIIITVPCFVVCCVYSKLLTKTPLDAWLFSMICIGVIIDFIGLIFFFLLNWSKTFHYYCSRLYNWFKKIFHMKYHTKQEIITKYKEKAVLKQSFYDSMKDWRTTGYILFFWIIGDILGLFSIVWTLCFVQNTIVYITPSDPQIVHVGFNLGWTLISARLTIPANRLNFLPGQAMGFEAAIVELLNVYGGWTIDKTIPDFLSVQKSVVSNAVLSGKIFLNWLPATAGIVGFIILTKQQVKLSNEGKLFQNK